MPKLEWVPSQGRAIRMLTLYVDGKSYGTVRETAARDFLWEVNVQGMTITDTEAQEGDAKTRVERAVRSALDLEET